MTYEWGPWIEHDGRGHPESLIGSYVMAVLQTHTGNYRTFEGRSFGACCVASKAWDWSFFGKSSGKGYAFGKVIKYRIRKPPALVYLQKIAHDVDATATKELVE